MSLQLELLKLNINISYSDIFMFPTIKELSNHITSSLKTSVAQMNIDEMSNFDTILNCSRKYPNRIQNLEVNYFELDNELSEIIQLNQESLTFSFYYIYII